MVDLSTEIERFRTWADSYPEHQRNGEWECHYGEWDNIYNALFEFLGKRPYGKWSTEETKNVLYAIARDNEMQHIAGEMRRHYPEILVSIVQAAIAMGERDTRWQLAEELGRLGRAGGKEEQLLLVLAGNEDEYVRRRALQSLARLDSPMTERLALQEWRRPDRDQEWSRMNVLFCLHKVRSSHLESLLEEAEHDEREYLSGYAKRIRGNEVLE